MKIAVSSAGTSLDAWTGVPFGLCSQFLVVDSESMEFVVISVPPDQLDPSKVSLVAIRAIARQETEVVITGKIKEICRQAMRNLGIQVIDGVERMTVREAVVMYAAQGAPAVQSYTPPSARIAVAAHGEDLDATLSPKGEPCTSFILVDPQSMAYKVIAVEPAESPAQASVNAVRAAAQNGATVVITPQLRPACCAALRALAIEIALAEETLTVREAIAAYQQGKLPTPPYL